MSTMGEITRREILQLGAGAALGSAANESAASRPADAKKRLYSGKLIEIYSSTLSVEPGDAVSLHVSTLAESYSLRIVRVGAKDRSVWSKDDLRGEFFASPDDSWEKGCAWPAAQSFKIPDDWLSGFYLISATTDAASQSEVAYAFFVVRATHTKSRILMVHATATYAAYNDYGGASLYLKRGNVNKGTFMGGERRVSLLRPWMPGFLWKSDNYDPSNNFGMNFMAYRWAAAAGFHNWERPLVHWLETNGYWVDHAISSDLDLHPELLGQYRLMLSVGHDEYWSTGMRDTVESFVKSGGNVCFLSGNVSLWKIRHEDQGRAIVCYKEVPEEDPLFKSGQSHLATTLWSSPSVRRPETSLTGLSMFYAGYAGFDGVTPQGAGGYLIYRPDHWIFNGTKIRYGDCLGKYSKIVNFEVDGCPIKMDKNLPYPSDDYDGPRSLEILGLCPAALPPLNDDSLAAARRLLGDSPAARALERIRGHAVMGLYTNNGTVFCAGTTDWTNGLTGKDPAVEQITRNLLDRLAK